ncbi:MAG: hypothetical protein HY790_01250 [Deltaproteobacteria bacterium]|nr:hypothetical protein [Deltaproteobacteria bacterium]MBI4794467.1 hypothetical protein [Deltaproteobacteria bacterium]
MEHPGSQVDRADDLGPVNQTWAIFLISVLGLFLEMLLIRWIGTEVRIFAYLQNTILVVCFLGLGLGCFTSRQPIKLRQMLLPLLILVFLLAVPITKQIFIQISSKLSILGDLVIWDSAFRTSVGQTILDLFLGLGLTYLLMVLILDIFIPIGRILGRLMDDHPHTIWAYSVNVAGSLVGTWIFVLLSFCYQPPVSWFLVFGGLALFFLPKVGRDRLVSLMMMVGIVILAWFAGQEWGALEVVWSPYQKLVVTESAPGEGPVGKYLVTVNNTGYQAMLNLSPAHIRANPQLFPQEMNGYSQYDIPVLLHPHPQKMLIVGAGSGNDASGGLRHGVKEIQAVEIDPAIIRLGQRYHPERPYSSNALKMINDDARSFFATSTEKYDVISFGLLDSHTTTAMTNARLDHYVYTRESITRAKSLLGAGGIMVLSFEAQKPFIADRMARVLREVFGAKPLTFRIPGTNYGWGGTMFVAGDLEAAQKQILKDPKLNDIISRWQKNYPVPLTYTTKVAADDWPYIYLMTPNIPILYYLLAGLMVLLFLHCRWKLKIGGVIKGWNQSDWHFFFLGAAFLLLEVQNISKAAVVFGNTWDVNAVIVSGVLAMILLANLIAHKFPRIPLGMVYSVLCGICLLLYFIDLSRFAFLPYASKVIAVGGLTTLPMLFSGIVFIRSFAAVSGKDKALGANLIGALVGALLQSVTFVTGIKALLLMVAGLYFLSMLTRPREVEQEKQFHEAIA